MANSPFTQTFIGAVLVAVVGSVLAFYITKGHRDGPPPSTSTTTQAPTTSTAFPVTTTELPESTTTVAVGGWSSTTSVELRLPPPPPPPPPPPSTTTQLPIRYESFVVPAGHKLRLRLEAAVGTEISQVEDIFTGKLTHDLKVGNHLLARSSAEVRGLVTQVNHPGRLKGKAALALNVRSVVLVDGSLAEIVTETVRLERSTRKKDVWTIVGGAVGGAAIGGAVGGKKGAAEGGAIGGGLGVTTTLVQKGDHVLLQPGTEITVKTSQRQLVRLSSSSSER
jgi:hypothetical protein